MVGVLLLCELPGNGRLGGWQRDMGSRALGNFGMTGRFWFLALVAVTQLLNVSSVILSTKCRYFSYKPIRTRSGAKAGITKPRCCRCSPLRPCLSMEDPRFPHSCPPGTKMHSCLWKYLLQPPRLQSFPKGLNGFFDGPRGAGVSLQEQPQPPQVHRSKGSIQDPSVLITATYQSEPHGPDMVTYSRQVDQVTLRFKPQSHSLGTDKCVFKHGSQVTRTQTQCCSQGCGFPQPVEPLLSSPCPLLSPPPPEFFP